MTSRPRRLKTIELTLTPHQIVLLWLKNAQKAGGYEDGWRQVPSPRGFIADAVHDAVRNSMKGYTDQVIEKAIQQARQQADWLYMLICDTNSGVLRKAQHTNSCYRLLLAHLCAVAQKPKNADLLKQFRLSLVMVVRGVLIMDAAVAQITSGHLDGQAVLFQDVLELLREQLQLAKTITDNFNRLALQAGVGEIDLDGMRTCIGSEVDRQVNAWTSLARAEMLVTFGAEDEWRPVLDQAFSPQAPVPASS